MNGRSRRLRRCVEFPSFREEVLLDATMTVGNEGSEGWSGTVSGERRKSSQLEQLISSLKDSVGDFD